jgi:hypothetical protein
MQFSPPPQKKKKESRNYSIAKAQQKCHLFILSCATYKHLVGTHFCGPLHNYKVYISFLLLSRPNTQKQCKLSYKKRCLNKKPYTLARFELAILCPDGGDDDHYATPPGANPST